MVLRKERLKEVDVTSEFLNYCLENVDAAWKEMKKGLKELNKNHGIKGTQFVSDEDGVTALYCYTIALNMLAVRNLFGSDAHMRILAHISAFVSDDDTNEMSLEESLILEFMQFAYDAIERDENPVEAMVQLFHYKITGMSMTSNPLEFTFKYGFISEVENNIAGPFWKNCHDNFVLVA